MYDLRERRTILLSVVVLIVWGGAMASWFDWTTIPMLLLGAAVAYATVLGFRSPSDDTDRPSTRRP
jgi:hypothetical protein